MYVHVHTHVCTYVLQYVLYVLSLDTSERETRNVSMKIARYIIQRGSRVSRVSFLCERDSRMPIFPRRLAHDRSNEKWRILFAYQSRRSPRWSWSICRKSGASASRICRHDDAAWSWCFWTTRRSCPPCRCTWSVRPCNIYHRYWTVCRLGKISAKQNTIYRWYNCRLLKQNHSQFSHSLSEIKIFWTRLANLFTTTIASFIDFHCQLDTFHLFVYYCILEEYQSELNYIEIKKRGKKDTNVEVNFLL